MADENNGRKKSLKYAIIDGCAGASMGSFGDSFIPPFAIFLKANTFLIGLLSALPSLFGSFSQLLSAGMLDKVKVRKNLIIPAATIHTFSWLPIFIVPFIFPQSGPILLVLCYMFCVFAGHFSSAPWTSLIGDLVEADKRGVYFAKRNRMANVFSYGTLLIAGFILQWFKPTNEWLGFAIIFTLALISRAISTYYMNLMEEPKYQMRPEDRFTLWDFVRRSPQSNFGRFVLYLALINMVVMIAGPFFAVYMLRDLNFSYIQFTIANGMTVLAQFCTMRYWGKLCDRYGNKKILTLCGYLIPFVPIVWLISSDFYWILIVQVFAGLIWGGFSLAASNFIFDAVSPPKRARCVAYNTLFNSIGGFIGAIFGGYLSHHLPQNLMLLHLTIPLASSLQILFLISGSLRLIISAIFLPSIREVRPVEKIATWRLILQIVPIRPALQPVFEIFAPASSPLPDIYRGDEASGSEREKNKHE
ncbi:MAG: MFS transporter [Planctomycetota bacterium]|nr:MFS transporter [Planctomycetota bacterium]MDI6787060.1 MFS transporter [Planctomycetota bacterium]